MRDEERAAFERDGYLVLRGMFEPGLVAELAARVDALAAGEAPIPAGVTRMEEPAVARGEAHVRVPAHRYRKLEGVPLATDSVIERAARHAALVGAMQDLLGEDLKLLRAAAMLKPPRVGSAKGLHQDAAYYPIEPMSHVAAWLALDATTRANGCMEVVPGGHRRGLLAHEARAYDTDVVVRGNTGLEPVALPMDAGDVLLTHCLTPHRSGPNGSDAPRRALILAYMDARSRYTLPPEERPPWVASLPIAGRSFPGCV